MFLLGCLSPLAEKSVSGLDAAFRWNRMRAISESPSFGIQTYRRGLSPFLAASCELFPHDSASLAYHQNHCGAFTAAFRAMERVYFEPSRSGSYGPTFLKDNQWLTLDLPSACEAYSLD